VTVLHRLVRLNDRSTFTLTDARTTNLRHCFFFADLLPLGVCVCFARAQVLPPQSFQIITGVGWISYWFNKNKIINNWLSVHNIRSNMKSNTVWSISSTIITGVGWISYWFTNIYKLINNWLPVHIRSNMKRSTDWYEYLRYFNSQRNQ